jgi:GAF domain-containing protein
MNGDVLSRIRALVESETDWVAVLSTVVCELHESHDHFHWTGFYRHTEPGLLKVGPYQGGHGCLRIPFERGVCGAAARTRRTQLVPDVRERADHIACSASTLSELVVPVLGRDGGLLAVLDIDSDLPDAFSPEDVRLVEAVCGLLGRHPAAPEASVSGSSRA